LLISDPLNSLYPAILSIQLSDSHDIVSANVRGSKLELRTDGFHRGYVASCGTALFAAGGAG
jgi:hypothetical protein